MRKAQLPIAPAALGRPEAAAYIGCSTDTLEWYVEKGWIVPRYHGPKQGKAVFKVADLDALLDRLPEERGAA